MDASAFGGFWTGRVGFGVRDVHPYQVQMQQHQLFCLNGLVFSAKLSCWFNIDCIYTVYNNLFGRYFYLTCPPTPTQLLALTSNTTKSTNTNNHYIHIHTIRLDLDTSTRLDADKWIFAMLQHLDQPRCIIGPVGKRCL